MYMGSDEEISEQADLDIQTELERVAQELNLSVDELDEAMLNPSEEDFLDTED